MHLPHTYTPPRNIINIPTYQHINIPTLYLLLYFSLPPTFHPPKPPPHTHIYTRTTTTKPTHSQKSIFVGNLDSSVEPAHIRKLFEDEGIELLSVDMKMGYAFVYVMVTDTLNDVVANLNGRVLGETKYI